jgi:hypothetical protein
MAIETNVDPVGTGQAGAGSPAGVNKEIPVHVEGHKPEDKLDQLADKSARRGIDRQHRQDSTEFTK